MKYKKFNDQELVSYVSEKHEDANEIVYEKYKPLITLLAKKIYKQCKYSGLEINDFMQEGFLGLNVAIKKFDSKKGVSFFHFSKTIIERRMISLAISTNRLKHKFLNDSISFNVFLNEKEISLENILGDTTTDPEILVLDKIKTKVFLEQINEQLTEFEKQVLSLRINDFNYEEMARLLNRSEKSIDNALQRIKNKIRLIMKE